MTNQSSLPIRFKEACTQCNEALNQAKMLILKDEFFLKTLSRNLNRMSHAFIELIQAFGLVSSHMHPLSFQQSNHQSFADGFVDLWIQIINTILRSTENLKELCKEPKNWKKQLVHWNNIIELRRLELKGGAQLLTECIDKFQGLEQSKA